MNNTMIILRWLLIAYTCCCSTLYAQGEPLNVGIESFLPPFVMQGANKEVYGFDVDMMNKLCQLMDRTCKFKVMRFDQLIPALVNKEIDVAVSGLTITAERATLVNFSTPYSLSYSRFLTKKSAQIPAFELSALNSKSIGVLTDTVFLNQLKEMGINKALIKTYPRTADLIAALGDGSVDYILVDSPTADYWDTNTESLVRVGPPFTYGFGLGIAVQPGNYVLLASINTALAQYENSPDFKKDYNEYLSQF